MKKVIVTTLTAIISSSAMASIVVNSSLTNLKGVGLASSLSVFTPQVSMSPYVNGTMLQHVNNLAPNDQPKDVYGWVKVGTNWSPCVHSDGSQVVGHFDPSKDYIFNIAKPDANSFGEYVCELSVT